MTLRDAQATRLHARYGPARMDRYYPKQQNGSSERAEYSHGVIRCIDQDYLASMKEQSYQHISRSPQTRANDVLLSARSDQSGLTPRTDLLVSARTDLGSARSEAGPSSGAWADKNMVANGKHKNP
eukprot:gene16309-4967_t